MEAQPPPTGDPPLQKLRLMCSYGGHIIPRPHDKTLSYIGGDTRIVLIDRHASLSDLHARLSKNLNQNYPFVLKYQLPNEDLDSLISVTTDEDFQNMIEEYDRLTNKQGRLRLFLFAKTVQSIDLGRVCGNKGSGSSEEWFLGLLNGKMKSLPSGFTDSVNCLLGLESGDNDDDKLGDFVGKNDFLESNLVENHGKLVGGGLIISQDVHSVPDSPIIQTNSSSFGSTSSSKSVKVGALGVEEQFHQMSGIGNVNYNVTVGDQKQLKLREEVVVVGSECVNRGAVSDDERLDHGRNVQEVVQQVQHIQQQVQVQQMMQQRQGGVGAFDFPSPDSVSSDGSITNPLSRQRQTSYQEPPIVQIQSGNNRILANQHDPKSMEQNSAENQNQPQIQESGYVLSGQYNQHHHPQRHHPPQYIQAGTQYIPSGPMPIPSYYPVYPSQHQNQLNQPVFDQPYPIYVIHARPPQVYNVPPNYSDLAANAQSSEPQKLPAPNVALHVAYNHHQALNVPSSKSETVSGEYRTLASTGPQLVQVPSSQNQSHYVGYTQIHHPSQSVAPQSSATSKAAYTYELLEPAHAQMYFTQPLPPHIVAQYQTVTSSSAMSVLSDASLQIPEENIKQQSRTVQK